MQCGGPVLKGAICPETANATAILAVCLQLADQLQKHLGPPQEPGDLVLEALVIDWPCNFFFSFSEFIPVGNRISCRRQNACRSAAMSGETQTDCHSFTRKSLKPFCFF